MFDLCLLSLPPKVTGVENAAEEENNDAAGDTNFDANVLQKNMIYFGRDAENVYGT